jgi:hypothetical protein
MPHNKTKNKVREKARERTMTAGMRKKSSGSDHRIGWIISSQSFLIQLTIQEWSSQFIA